MPKTIEEINKALVLDAFDALFNRRDYKAAERFWSPDYIQHSAHIAPLPSWGNWSRRKPLAPWTSTASKPDSIALRADCRNVATFIANPDLVERIRTSAPLNAFDRATAYGGSAHGHTDYPRFLELADAE